MYIPAAPMKQDMGQAHAALKKNNETKSPKGC